MLARFKNAYYKLISARISEGLLNRKISDDVSQFPADARKDILSASSLALTSVKIPEIVGNNQC